MDYGFFSGKFFSKGKKAFIISEALIIPLSLAIVGMMIFMASSISIVDEKSFENLTPELNYEFPKTVVYSFVNFPLSDNDSMVMFGDKNSRVISDLMWIGSDDSKDLIIKYREFFLKDSGFDFVEYLDLYNSFSGDDVSLDDLLKIKFDVSFTGSLESELDNRNFFLRVPRNSNTDILVYFKGDGN
jgi:hypothetical protein